MRVTALTDLTIQAYVIHITETQKLDDGKKFQINSTIALQTFHMREGEIREDIAMVMRYSRITYKAISKDGKPIETHSDFILIDSKVEYGVIDDVLLIEPWDYFKDRLP